MAPGWKVWQLCEVNGARLDGEDSFPSVLRTTRMDCRGARFALVLVKSWQTERAAHQLVDCLAEDGLAVTFQNGLGNDDNLSGILGTRRVSRGVTTLGATLTCTWFVRVSGRGEMTLESALTA